MLEINPFSGAVKKHVRSRQCHFIMNEFDQIKFVKIQRLDQGLNQGRLLISQVKVKVTITLQCFLCFCESYSCLNDSVQFIEFDENLLILEKLPCFSYGTGKSRVLGTAVFLIQLTMTLTTKCRVVCFIHLFQWQVKENTVSKTNNELIEINSKHIYKIWTCLFLSGGEISTSQKQVHKM